MARLLQPARAGGVEGCVLCTPSGPHGCPAPPVDPRGQTRNRVKRATACCLLPPGPRGPSRQHRRGRGSAFSARRCLKLNPIDKLSAQTTSLKRSSVQKLREEEELVRLLKADSACGSRVWLCRCLTP